MSENDMRAMFAVIGVLIAATQLDAPRWVWWVVFTIAGAANVYWSVFA